ncbi:MAG: DUF2293 domain-containing protein [Hyphomicrobiales bacterium]|nr:DUF2293 domain-containing protein [Hyphomicrobiales bacterium]
MATKRQQATSKALRGLAPLIPMSDAQDVLAKAGGPGLRELTPTAAVWLALTSHVRHRFTDYDHLLREGYDRDAARFFVVEETERQLAAWGCTRPLVDAGDEAG